jgi:hypothetical protein
MNRKVFTMCLVIGSVVLGSALALGNPSMLPNHPGYSMGDAKDPVTGQAVANDPGQTAPSQKDSLQQAGRFHDTQTLTPSKEERASIVQPGASQSIEAQSESTK